MLNISIDLKNSSDAHGFAHSQTNTEMVHQRQFELVKFWIDECISKLKKSKSTTSGISGSSRIHDTITVLGTRGSGKTSFLLSLQEHYKKEKEIEILKIIDPTLIEDKGHVFLSIISLIKDEVDKKIEVASCCPGDKYYGLMTTWKKKLEDLAHGLPSMDGIGGNLTDNLWQDAEYIMQRGLRSVSSARRLEETFNELVKISLETLGKEAFLIVFDDIDVDFKKGWPVLETIRKYLTSPQIITVLSGDLRLYSISIRKQQWLNFGKAILINEGQHLSKVERFDDLVTEMEGQYLQKVLKPERRIMLTSLNEKVNSPHYVKNYLSGHSATTTNEDPDSFCISVFFNEHRQVEISRHYDNILSDFGINNSYLSEAYRSFILSRPLRMQIRILTAYETSGIRHRVTGILQSLISDLYEKQVDINLAESNPNFINIVIFDLLLKQRVLNDSYQLQPTTTDESLNASLLGLSLLFSTATLNNPYLIFDYFVRIGCLRNLAFSMDYGEGGNYEFASIHGICEHAGINKDKVLRDIGGAITSYMLAYLKRDESSRSSWGGIIELMGLAQKARRNLRDRIDSVFEKMDGTIQKTLAYLPLSICTPPNSQQSSLVYSFYTLLGSIGELIRKVNLSDVNRGLLELSQLRSYPMPSFAIRWKSVSEGLGEGANEDFNFASNLVDELRPIIISWISNYPSIAISPHVLGKVATRFYYAFDAISENEKTDSLGDAMHNRVVAFMNSILIEEIKENIQNPEKLNINNTNFSDQGFINNLKNNLKFHEKLSFSRWMLSCPIFLCYLNKEASELINTLDDFCRPFDIKPILENSIYDYLINVAVKGGKLQPVEGLNTVIKTPRKTKRYGIYNKLIHELSLRGVPYNLFIDSDIRTNSRNNRSIKQLLPDQLFQDFFYDSAAIRKFRRYLLKYNIKW